MQDYLCTGELSVRERVRAHIAEEEILKWVFTQETAHWIKWIKVDQVLDATVNTPLPWMI